MNSHDIEKLIKSRGAEIVAEPDRKRCSFEILRAETAKKQQPPFSDKKSIFCSRITHMDKRFFAAGLAGNLLLLLLLLSAKNTVSEEEGMFVFIMAAGVLSGTLAIAVSGRAFTSKTAELSESCYFNVRQMVAMDMVIAALMNMVVFLFALPAVGRQWQVGILRLGVYFLVPHLLAESCCLLVLLTERGRSGRAELPFTGGFLSIVCVIAAFFPQIYERAALVYWGGAFAAGLLLLFACVKRLFEVIEKGEMICADWI